MCGISGLYSAKLDDDIRRARLKMALDSHRHRGPDSIGILEKVELKFSAGMSRLAITDEENGNQPFRSSDNSKILFFNGELFNFRELRRQLEQEGIIFSTDCDTEVMLHGFTKYGEDFLKRVNGFFAFCFLDLEAKELTIARDALGVKPIFYAVSQEDFIFSSEMRAILYMQDKIQTLDLNSIGEYLKVGFVSAPKTMFNGVNQLLPGELLQFDFDKLVISKQKKWFGLCDAYNSSKSSSGSQKRLKDHISDAVTGRFQSDKEEAYILLSGGIDSNIVRHAMGNRKTKNYTFRFREDENSEVDRLKNLDIDVHEIKMTFEECIDFLPKCVETMELPVNDTAMLPTYILCKEISKHSKIVFSGLGADEFFLGYSRHSDGLLFERIIRQLTPNKIISLARFFRGHFAERVLWNSKPLWQRYIDKISVFSHDEAEEVLGQPLNSIPIPNEFNSLDNAADNREVMGLFDAAYYLPNNILYLSDKMSMAHSVEVREPFLDSRLIQAVMNMDPKDKLPLYPRRVFKNLLKKLYQKELPNSLISGKKKGFAGPTQVWWQSGKLQSYAAQKMENSELVKDGILSSKYFEKMLSTNFIGMSPNKIISLLLLEIWYSSYRRFL